LKSGRLLKLEQGDGMRMELRCNIDTDDGTRKAVAEELSGTNTNNTFLVLL
jgi:hypothetical protein